MEEKKKKKKKKDSDDILALRARVLCSSLSMLLWC